MELPSVPDAAVAFFVGSSALGLIGLIVLFVLLHCIFYKVVPAYCALLSLGILFNFAGSLDYTHQSLKALSRLNEGPVILKLFGLMLLGYSAAMYHVGNSKCPTTKSINALVFGCGALAVLHTMVGDSWGPKAWSTLLSACATRSDTFLTLLLVTCSLLVALGHYLAPRIEDYLANAGCDARSKVILNI